MKVNKHSLRKAFSAFFLMLSLACFVSCVTLDPAEQCALIGQVQQGTQIGTRMNIGSAGGVIYSYPSTTYNPICKLPTTEEEEAVVAELFPIAKEKADERSTLRSIYIFSVVIVVVGAVILKMALVE